jgi:GT2 family glycosyltransferase
VPADRRVSVVVLTHNRARELERCLDELLRLPEQPHVIAVDNASDDGTIDHLATRFPGVEWLRCARNLGAAGRNTGVARVSTPYVAFCDDDTWWEAGALGRAADLLDLHPRLGAISARVLVGADDRLDPSCERMAASPLDAKGLPGPALIGFMAGAVVMRTDAFREAGGYEPRFFLGAEEALMGLEFAARD